MWEDLNATDEWSEMTQLGLRILLGFAAYDDIEVGQHYSFLKYIAYEASTAKGFNFAEIVHKFQI